MAALVTAFYVVIAIYLATAPLRKAARNRDRPLYKIKNGKVYRA